MVDTSYMDLSDVIETFDADEAKRLLDAQLDAIHDDSCEGMIDNLKMLYKRYASIRDQKYAADPDTQDQAKALFYNICEMYIRRITDTFDISLDETYQEDHYEDLPSIALLLYVFFVLDLRSNLYNVLLSYIGQHIDEIAEQFDAMRQRKDSISEVNRTLEDQDIALIASNIYDVIDYVMADMDAETFFENMESGYIGLAPMKTMYTSCVIDDGFIDILRDILKENIAMKARIGFDIICRLKGYNLNG